ncbi:MAG: hypothetical protein CSB47_01615 [Proteobacteria bacterium]|nr:MAG: hypothetical protein CSB47_01615 [Pseudomonadota bacterium]
MKIKAKRRGLGVIGVKSAVLSILLVTACFAVDDENSLANRLKAFNQLEGVAAVQKVSLKQTLKRRKGRSSFVPACYRSPTAILRQRAEQYQPYIQANSRRYSVDEDLIISVITAESCFVKHARSHMGAQGLMQLIPATAKRFGVKNAYQASQNIRGGTRYLSFLLKRFSGNMRHAIAAYNAGEGAVDRYDGVPPYKETKEYVRRVMAVYHRLKGNAVMPGSLGATTTQKAVWVAKKPRVKRGYFIKPDYKWVRKPRRNRLAKRRSSRVYTARSNANIRTAAGYCRDNPSAAMRRTTDLIKRTRQWNRFYTVTHATPLSQIARRTGVSMKVLLRLNRGISRFNVKPGKRVLVWQCVAR